QTPACATAALYRRCCIMPHCYMLGNGQSQSRAAGGTGAAAVYPVKAFRQTGDVLRGNTDACVLDGIAGLSAFGDVPADRNGAVPRGLAFGRGQQVGYW